MRRPALGGKAAALAALPSSTAQRAAGTGTRRVRLRAWRALSYRRGSSASSSAGVDRLGSLNMRLSQQALQAQQRQQQQQQAHQQRALKSTVAAADVASGGVESMAPAAAGKTLSPRALAKCYAQLGKARLSTFVVGSAACGYLLAGAPVNAAGLAAVSVGVALQSASANTLNQIYEVRTDALMARTRTRPLPSGRVSRAHAAAFSVACGAAGTGLLAASCNPISAGLGFATIALYAGVYTPLKQMTPWNTQVGAVVGALPPLIGYSAATGTLSVEAGILAAGLYYWQLPHFYALAWMYKKDYLAGGHKMLSSVDPTGSITARSMICNSAALSSLPVACYSLGITNAMFPLESLAFNGYLMWESFRFKNDPSVANARRVFKASLLYLPVFMGLMLFHKNGWSHDDGHDSATTAAASASLLARRQTNGSGSAAPLADDDFYELAPIERNLMKAKAAMKSICIHEYLTSPPLTRLTQNGASSSSSNSSRAGLAPSEEPAADQPGFCPVTTAKSIVDAVQHQRKS